VSANGLTACLFHVMAGKSEHQVAYASHTLMAPEKNYAKIEHEALVIIAVCRFHQHPYEKKLS